MSDISFNSDNFNYYAFVVDGEVAFVMPVSVNQEHINAVFASEAVVYAVSADKKGEVKVGWTYADGEFSPPVV